MIVLTAVISKLRVCGVDYRNQRYYKSKQGIEFNSLVKLAGQSVTWIEGIAILLIYKKKKKKKSDIKSLV